MAAIKIGTEFRYTIRDENPLWKVVAKQGRGGYLAEIMSETIDMGPGRDPYVTEGGETKAFLTEEIQRALNFEKFWSDLKKSDVERTKQLKVGQIVHVDNGFAQFIRCKVVSSSESNVLEPIGLVGNWQQRDLAIRYVDGTIGRGTYARFLAGESPKGLFNDGRTTLGINASNIWELKDQKARDYSMRSARPPTPTQTVNFPRYEAPFDPAAEPLLSLDLPAPTADEQELISLHAHRKIALDILGMEGLQKDDPQWVRLALKSALVSLLQAKL